MHGIVNPGGGFDCFLVENVFTLLVNNWAFRLFLSAIFFSQVSKSLFNHHALPCSWTGSRPHGDGFLSENWSQFGRTPSLRHQ